MPIIEPSPSVTDCLSTHFAAWTMNGHPQLMSRLTTTRSS